jgi:general secretion pathway protein G
MNVNQPTRAGLTLVEVLAVVVILSLLAVALVVGLGGRLGAAKQGIATTQMTRVIQAIETYQTVQGRLPQNIGELNQVGSAWHVEAAQLRDPWGNALELVVPGPDNRPFEVLSYGADGQPGGEGENADISSATLAE